MLNFNVIIIVIVSIFLVFFGWKLRKIYKRIVFFILKRHAKKSEKEAIVLLKKHNFDIIDEQFKVNHYLYENNKKKSFSFRPDLLVQKNGVEYFAEIKSGQASYIENINTRRQLLEYFIYSKKKSIILVDTENSIIKKIDFVFAKESS
ncbi:MAG: hypothetical protein CMP24_03635 [Rickettsiales bacterium]|mgnify:CR=1 FL=1|nr:hypothetical protein [Rickettsiales bacterium]|tara:strand:+ start:643 stop:1086 length:444 start_codon:yes stop_codon:yes gene_type:complete